MSLTSVDEIERAIRELSPGEVEDLYERLDHNFESARNFESAIDKRISSDVAAGLLDDAIFRALEDEANNRLRPL